MSSTSKKPGFSFRLWHLEFLLLAGLAAILIAWVIIPGMQPSGPDEQMRYVVARFFYNHPGQLPNGGAEELRDPQWGFSYALYPYLAYMIMSVFMRITSLFTSSDAAILYSARMVNVVLILLTAVLLYKIGQRLFGGAKGFFFSSLVVFMPGFHFLGVYINCDALALFSAALILYAWVRVLQEGCTWKNCLIISVGMGICFLSYYNAYGWILCSFIYFCLMVFLCRPATVSENVRFFITRALFCIAITLGISGWFFIHNYIIYDGDFLGLNTSTWLGETYAEDWLKPSQHETPQKMGWSALQLITLQVSGWPHNWLILSLVSYVGTFGLFNIFMNDTVSLTYVGFISLGMLGFFIMMYRFSLHDKKVTVTRGKTNGVRTKTISISTMPTWNKQSVFNLAMLLAMIIPVIIYVHYVYVDDLQAQGRYMILSVYPVMYFVTLGFSTFFARIKKIARFEQLFYIVISALWIFGAFFNFFTVIYPWYR